ncbi:hypothetical protein OH76DRAFT_1404618 [Lentinus brumalis]|uniref:Uncharacterized protein n=1 Tax=Lentinus brumalis TaxID=2498619 RepID=A0A371D816_9APHY|nr:hypothetical protein OH76DRAFT_1404618 [Polyporus brumalis]
MGSCKHVLIDSQSIGIRSLRWKSVASRPLPQASSLAPIAMSNCKRCTHPLYDEYFPPGGAEMFEAFDTLAVIESAHNPVEQEIFNKTVRAEGTDVQMFEKRFVDDPDFKGRPAIALDSGELFPTTGEPVCTRVLLTATYRGQFQQRRHLPMILQRFGVGIYQHQTIANEPLRFHLHTRPEWINSHSRGIGTNAWLIAREYPFEGDLAQSGHWRNVKAVDTWSCSSFTVEEEQRKELKMVMEDSWRDWTDTCEFDPETLGRCVKDYVMFSKGLGKYRKKAGKPLPPKPKPNRNTTPIRKNVSSSHTLANTEDPARRRALPVNIFNTNETKQHVDDHDPQVDMLQKKPINFAHPSLARPLAEQSAASEKDTLGTSTPLVGVADDSLNSASKPEAVAAAAASSSGRAPPVTAQVLTNPEAAELVGTTNPSAPVPPRTKVTYAQMLKAGAASSQPAQRPAREMMPA